MAVPADRKVVQDVLSGLIGRELALSFERFSTDVLPSDVINRFKDVEGKVNRMSRNQMIGLVWGVVSNAKDLGKRDKKDKDLPKKMDNVLDFMNALAKAARKLGLKVAQLVDYRVRIPPGGKHGALVETVITWRTGPRTEAFSTLGVDSDQMAAAVIATEKMLNLVASRAAAQRS